MSSGASAGLCIDSPGSSGSTGGTGGGTSGQTGAAGETGGVAGHGTGGVPASAGRGGVATGGAVWAWLYERTGSLWAAWLSHLLVDTAIMAVGYDLVFVGPGMV